MVINTMRPLIFTLLLALFSYSLNADNPPGSMDNKRLDELIKRIDPGATGAPGNWSVNYEGYTARVITDEAADRMRIVVGIVRADGLKKEILYRLMQANFDTTIDARYSIANGFLWSAFIHPLSPLTDNEFLSGLAQVINLTSSYGKSFSSGALHFRGGDSEGVEMKRYRELMNKGEQI